MAKEPSSSLKPNIKGAVYISARAYNAYQMWHDYSPEQAGLDMGYAAKLKLNSLRVFLSYEFWLENRKEHEETFEHLLKLASQKGIRIMPCLFECCGIEPTREALSDRNPLTGACVHSPSFEVVSDCRKWGRPFEFLEWFMNRYRNDMRILAIELINEPHETGL